MWTLRCVPSWQANRRTEPARRAGSGCRAGSGDAELLGKRRSHGFLESLLGWPCETEGWGGEEVVPLWQKHSHWLISQLSAHICSRRISQDPLCCSRRQGWLGLRNQDCHTASITGRAGTMHPRWVSSGHLCVCVHSVMSNFLRPHGLSGSPVHEIFQARILEQVAISYSRGSS